MALVAEAGIIYPKASSATLDSKRLMAKKKRNKSQIQAKLQL